MLERVSSDGFALRNGTEELKGDREIVMKAVSNCGFALDSTTETAIRLATKELKDDEEILQHALERSRDCSYLVGLKVVLMSGKCCTEVFELRAGMIFVLRLCAPGSRLRGEKRHSHAQPHQSQTSQRVVARQAA